MAVFSEVQEEWKDLKLCSFSDLDCGMLSWMGAVIGNNITLFWQYTVSCVIKIGMWGGHWFPEGTAFLSACLICWVKCWAWVMCTGVPEKNLGMMLLCMFSFLSPSWSLWIWKCFRKHSVFAFFPLENRFVTYDPVNIRDHYFWGILVYILIFLSGVLLWVEF